MSKWEKVKLGDIGDFKSGGTPTRSKPEYFEGEIPWITTTSLGKTFIDEDDATTYISQEAVFNSATKLISKNSIMIGTRVGVGKVSINTVPMCTSQDIISIENINEEHFYKPYILHSINSYNRYFDTQKRGATIQGINSGVLKSIDIPKPPLGTQKQIAKTLDTAAELLAMRKHQLSELDNLIKATFYEMFGDPVANDKGWSMPLVEDTVSKEKNAIKAGPFGSALKKEFYVEQGYKIYGQEQVIKDDPNFGDYYISESKYKELENCAIQENDVLISLVGTYGKLIIIPKEFEKGIINPRLMKITFDKEIVNTTYFKYYFVSDSLKNRLSEVSRGGTMDILNVGIVRKLAIPIPPLELQSQFATIVNKIEKQKSLVKKAIEETQHLFDSLMSEYFE
ncbi:restriction endonuclease subunit S [Paenibacillus sp. FSL P4-0184]|uniref:restriction endonuclease subunit S n=1 Tax=Paenibacillus sp. FSL P4-0184 TaxID=2921632 RepID=UPI0030F52209